MMTNPADESEVVLTKQPTPPAAARNLVHVRTFTPEDADFYGALLVEAFRNKSERTMGKNHIEDGKKMMAKISGGMSQEEYPRHLIAEVNNERAGILGLMFCERLPAPDDFLSTVCGAFNCCSASRLLCIFLGFNENVQKGFCYIDHVCVDENFRGQGVGKVLMEHAEAEARQFGCHTLYLDVVPTNRARNLYERQGFQVTRNKDPCCGECLLGDEGHFYVMEKKLN